jgi:RNA polymerase sigma-B factor
MAMAIPTPIPATEWSGASEREAMIERHLPLARRLARRYIRSQDVADDIEQVAALGLVKAVDRFDPERGRSFVSFATPTILGEIKRHFRDTRWAVHVPRELQERAQRVLRESDRLTARLGRAPTLAEIADAVGCNVEEVLEAREAFTGFDAESLDAPMADEGDDGADTLSEVFGSADGGYLRVEERVTIAPAVSRLPERDRTALRLRFDEDMTQAEIGSALGISQMQVSRILRRSLSAVREAVDSRRPADARASRGDRRAATTSGRVRESAFPPRPAA